MVLFACCLLPCCTLVFSLSWHTHLFFVSSMWYCLLARAFSSCFCLSSLLALTPCLHARFWTRLSPQGHRPARPVNGGGVPSVPELSLVFVSLRPLGGLPHLCLLRVFSCSFSGYLPLFSCGVCTCSLPPICSLGDAFRHIFLVLGCRLFFHYCSRDAFYDGFCFRLAFPGFHLTVPRLHLLPMFLCSLSCRDAVFIFVVFSWCLHQFLPKIALFRDAFRDVFLISHFQRCASFSLFSVLSA